MFMIIFSVNNFMLMTAVTFEQVYWQWDALMDLWEREYIYIIYEHVINEKVLYKSFFYVMS
jgi:hypothetical protein